MQFGIPNQRRVKEEKYSNTPVMTLSVEGDKGTARSMVFNPKACELLGLPETDALVAFSFQDGIFVLNGGQVGVPSEHTIKVTKNAPRRISDKKTYEYMSKVLGLDNSVENEFKLISNPVLNTIVTFKLESLNQSEEVKSSIEQENVTTVNSDIRHSDTNYSIEDEVKSEESIKDYQELSNDIVQNQ